MNKIHVVEFTSGTTAKTITGLFQWNFGQILQIKGLDLPSAVEVHFALRRSGEAIRRIGVTKDGVTEVEIPDVLFKTMMTSDYDIYAYVYVSDEEYGSTTHEIILKVKSRPMPDDVSDNFEKIMEAVKAIADGKVDKEQGVENNGKFLGVVDGYVALMDAPSGGTANAVQYVAQELTEEQQEQARANIGAANVTYDTETKTLNICLGRGTTNGLIEQIEDYVIENEIEKIVIDGVEVNLSRYAKKEETDRLSEEKVDQTQLINAVNNALTEAKESGEFDGAKGDKGDTGEQGVQGEKGETGATGEKGADGTSVTVSSVSESPEDGGSNIVTFSDGTKLTVKNGSKGSQGEKGEQGIQGIQGDKGDKGDTGETGANGKDYVLTEADKEEIARMIDEVLILTEAELEALTQEELAEKYAKGTKFLIIKESENLVHIAISPSGEIYNGCGYLSGYRLNSSGGISESENSAMTGFIPYVYGSEIHISGGLQVASYGGQYLNAYNENFELLASLYLDGAISNSGGSSSFDDKNIRHDIVKTASFSNSTYANAFKNASYIRIALNPCVGKDIVVSYN